MAKGLFGEWREEPKLPRRRGLVTALSTVGLMILASWTTVAFLNTRDLAGNTGHALRGAVGLAKDDVARRRAIATIYAETAANIETIEAASAQGDSATVVQARLALEHLREQLSK